MFMEQIENHNDIGELKETFENILDVEPVESDNLKLKNTYLGLEDLNSKVNVQNLIISVC